VCSSDLILKILRNYVKVNIFTIKLIVAFESNYLQTAQQHVFGLPEITTEYLYSTMSTLFDTSCTRAVSRTGRQIDNNILLKSEKRKNAVGM
jgi:hypothetical protein